jgi:hypothetical protein
VRLPKLISWPLLVCCRNILSLGSLMKFDKVSEILCRNDGSLPDIDFDFGVERMVGDAYALIQDRAGHLACEHAYYWSKSKEEECPIIFGDNPALAVLAGDAHGFHVVFGGLTSHAGAAIPDLGVFVLDSAHIALDYRMGPEWDGPAILGLFEVMRDLRALSDTVAVSHTGNIFESEEGILLTEFKKWADATSS